MWRRSPRNRLQRLGRDSRRLGTPLIQKSAEVLSKAQTSLDCLLYSMVQTIEPETGATVTGYDAAGNPAWSASGLTGGDYANALDCSYAAANASGRVVNRIYDPRNRISQLQGRKV
jgi:hypothetical protein